MEQWKEPSLIQESEEQPAECFSISQVRGQAGQHWRQCDMVVRTSDHKLRHLGSDICFATNLLCNFDLGQHLPHPAHAGCFHVHKIRRLDKRCSKISLISDILGLTLINQKPQTYKAKRLNYEPSWKGSPLRFKRDESLEGEICRSGLNHLHDPISLREATIIISSQNYTALVPPEDKLLYQVQRLITLPAVFSLKSLYKC